MRKFELAHKRDRSGLNKAGFGAAVLLLSFGVASHGETLIPSSPIGASVNHGLVLTEIPAPGLAFSRYLSSLQERNPFTESGPVTIEIEARVPRLNRTGRLRAIRQTSDSERSEYVVTFTEGDAVVNRQLIAGYLAAARRTEALPYSAVAVVPQNYKFQFDRAVETNRRTAYIFQIAPKKKRIGLMRGEIWIDAVSGNVIHQAGRLVKRPSVFIRREEIASSTNLRDGVPAVRVTHVSIEARHLGRAVLTVTERSLRDIDGE